jgi:hypothetical protein
MSTLVKLTLASTALVLAVLPAQADQTNLVQRVNIRLMAFQQGGTSTNRNLVITSLNTSRVGTREVVAALGTATGNSFSSSASLVMITPLPSGAPQFAVRDRGASVDVSGYMVLEQLSGAVGDSLVNNRTGRASSDSYSIQHFVLQDGGSPINLHFDVRGIGDASSSTNGGWTRSALDADVSGAGDQSGNLLILEGSISIRGNTLEVVPSSPGNPPGV